MLINEPLPLTLHAQWRQVYDPSVNRYQVPLQVPQATRNVQHPDYTLKLVNDTFSFAVSRTNDNKTEM